MHKLITGGIITAAMASTASGAILPALVQVDNSAALSGYTTQDLIVSTDSDWTGASLLLELTAGSLYQDPGAGMVGGGFLPTNPFFFPWFPAAEFDTSVGTLDGAVLGGSSSVGGDGGLEFSTTRLNVSFYNFATTDIGTLPIGRFTLSNGAAGLWSVKVVNAVGDVLELLDGSIADGVMTLGQAPLAAGGLAGISTEEVVAGVIGPNESIAGIPIQEQQLQDSGFTIFTGNTIINNTLPEPATLSLLGLSAAALLRRRP